LPYSESDAAPELVGNKGKRRVHAGYHQPLALVQQAADHNTTFYLLAVGCLLLVVGQQPKTKNQQLLF
jgi:hypothetical protein